MVGQGNGLGLLQVGVARHDGVGVPGGVFQNGPEQRRELFDRAGNGRLHVKPHIQRHLVVAAAAGVHPLARRADALGQKRFNVHVDVFGPHRKLHLAGFNIG